MYLIAKNFVFRNNYIFFSITLDNVMSSSTDEYPHWLKEQEELEIFEREQIEAMNKAENEKWIAAEKITMQHWQELQQKKEKLRTKRLEKEAKLRMVNANFTKLHVIPLCDQRFLWVIL